MEALFPCMVFFKILISSVVLGRNLVDCDFENDLCGWKSINPLQQYYKCSSGSHTSQCIPWFTYDLPHHEKIVWVPWIRLAPRDRQSFNSIEEAMFHTGNYTSIPLPIQSRSDNRLQRASAYHIATDHWRKSGFTKKNSAVLVSTINPYSVYLRNLKPVDNVQKYLRSYLISEELPSSYDIQCLHYSYLVTGSAELSVTYIPGDTDISSYSSNTKDILLEKTSLYVPEFFMKMQINLPPRAKSRIVFKTRFLKLRDGNNFAFLDDINIRHNICSATVICNDGEFRCLVSKQCINGAMYCDGKTDCSDGTDEERCINNTNKRIISGISEYSKSSPCGINLNKNNVSQTTDSKESTGVPGEESAKNGMLNITKNVGSDDKCAIYSSICTCFLSGPTVKSSSWKKCFKGFKANFYHFFRVQNLTCLNVTIPHIHFLRTYSFTLVNSNITNLRIVVDGMKNLQHIKIRNTIVESLVIYNSKYSTYQLQTLQLINCTLKEATLNIVNVPLSTGIDKIILTSFDRISIMKGVVANLSFYNEYIDLSLQTFKTFNSKGDGLPFRMEFQCELSYTRLSYVFFVNEAQISVRFHHDCTEMIFINFFMKNNMQTFPNFRSSDISRSKYFSMQSNAVENISEITSWLLDIKMIDLSSNKITIIEKRDFMKSTSLKILKLQNNLIRAIMDNAFEDLISLFLLDLSNNAITVVSLQHFILLKNLRFLFLNYNKINVIHAKAFSNLIALHTLDLSFNNIMHFAEGQFFGMESLENLYIQNNRIFSVNGMFWGLFNLKFLKVDEFSICCARPRSRNDLQCVAPVNEIASCENLISAPVLNVAIWYIAFLATIGNMIAMICSTSTFKRSSFAYFIFSRNLSVADFLMGIYLYIIACTNLVYAGKYGFKDYSWRHSFLCTFAGILSTVSSEASALFVLMITIDRVIAIKNPFSRRNKLWVIGSSVLTWVIAISLAVFPVLPLQLSMFEDFYAQSPVCISLPLSVHRQLGWQYSMVIFIGLNFLIFLGIIFGQFLILYEVIKSGSNSQASNIRRREITLAKSVVAVVVTDLLCWIPIGIIGMLTFYGIDVTLEIYAWIIVLVLPINSAINPILYTLTAIIRDRGRRKVSESNIQKEKELLAQENYRLKQKLKIQRDSTNSYM